jgi:hypothetical protein
MVRKTMIGTAPRPGFDAPKIVNTWISNRKKKYL